MLRRTRSRFARPHWILPIGLVLSFFLVFDGGTLLDAQISSGQSYTDTDLYRGLFLADGPVAQVIPEIRDHLAVSVLTTDRSVQLAIRGLHGRIINNIQTSDPTFLPFFGAAMRSGDHLRIDRAFEVAGEATVRAVSTLPEVVQLREDLAADPSLRDQILSEMHRAEGADQIPEGEIERAFDLLIADSLNSTKAAQEPYIQAASIVVLIVAVAAVVAAITVVAAMSYAAALNVAGAVNFAAALVAYRWVWTPRQRNFAEGSLFREQLTDSVVAAFGPA